MEISGQLSSTIVLTSGSSSNQVFSATGRQEYLSCSGKMWSFWRLKGLCRLPLFIVWAIPVNCRIHWAKLRRIILWILFVFFGALGKTWDLTRYYFCLPARLVLFSGGEKFTFAEHTLNIVFGELDSQVASFSFACLVIVCKVQLSRSPAGSGQRRIISFDDFLFNALEMHVLQTRQLLEFFGPDRLHPRVGPGCWYYSASDCVLVLVEERHVLHTDKSEIVDVLLDACDCLAGNYAQKIRRGKWSCRGGTGLIWTWWQTLSLIDPVCREEHSLTREDL